MGGGIGNGECGMEKKTGATYTVHTSILTLCCPSSSLPVADGSVVERWVGLHEHCVDWLQHEYLHHDMCWEKSIVEVKEMVIAREIHGRWNTPTATSNKKRL